MRQTYIVVTALQVVMVRLRSGKNRLNAHMYRKYRLVQSPTCPCGEEDQTVDHILQRCKRLDQEPVVKWLKETFLYRKIYGDTSRSQILHRDRVVRARRKSINLKYYNKPRSAFFGCTFKTQYVWRVNVIDYII